MLRIAEFALLAARLLLAFVFLLAGAAKFFDPVGLRKALRDFGVPPLLAKPSLVLLPLLEIMVAVALIPRGLAWYGAWGALGLLTAFLVAIGILMLRGRKPECRCFGQLHSRPVGWPTLIRDSALAACAGWLVWRGPLRSRPSLWAWFAALNGQQKKIALIAAGAAGFLFFRLLDRSRPETESLESEPSPEVDEQAPAAPPPSTRRPVAKERPAPPESAETTRPVPVKPSPKGIGLPVGTPAPEFELPAVSGGKRSLRSLREQGRDVLLVFSNPFCEACHRLTPNLVHWTRDPDGSLNIVVISRGPVPDLLAKLKEFETSRILLQREFEIGEAYDCNSTPTAVLVSADGLIQSELAVGREAIQQLVTTHSKSARQTGIVS